MQKLYNTANYQASAYANSNTTIVIGKDKYVDITSRNGGVSGISSSQTLQFYLNKIPDALSFGAELRIKVNALNTTGSPTNPRLCDAFALFLFDHITIKSNQQNILDADLYPQSAVHNIRNMTDPDNWDFVKKALGIGTVVERAANAAAEQTFVIPLNMLFKELQQIPLFLINENSFQIELKTVNNFNSLVEYTGGTSPSVSFTISDLRLRINYTESPGAAGVLNQTLKSGITVADFGLPSGLAFDSLDYLIKQYPVAAGTSSTSLQLPELTDKSVVTFIMTSHNESDLAGAGGVANYTNYTNVIKSFNIMSGSSYVDGSDFPLEKTDLNWLCYESGVPNAKEIVNSNAWVLPYSNDFRQNNELSGFSTFAGARDFTGVQNCTVKLYFNGPLAANTVIYIHVLYAKKIIIKANGEYQDLSTAIRTA